MAWILSLLALLSFMVLCVAKSVVLGFVCLLLMLAFMLGTIVLLLSSRIDRGSRDAGRMLTPEELRSIREHAQSKRAPVDSKAPDGAKPGASNPDAPPPPPPSPTA